MRSIARGTNRRSTGGAASGWSTARLARALACVVGLVGALVVAGAGSAAAHTELTGTTPKAGARLAAAPRVVVLEFNEPISRRFARVAVTGPGGEDVTQGSARVDGGTVRQPVQGNGGSGAYRVAYRVVSADGHPVSGQQRFTVRPAPTPTSTPPASSSDTSADTSSDPATPSPQDGTSAGAQQAPTPSTPPAEDVAQQPVTSPVQSADRTMALVLPIAAAACLALLGVGAWGVRRRTTRRSDNPEG